MDLTKHNILNVSQKSELYGNLYISMYKLTNYWFFFNYPGGHCFLYFTLLWAFIKQKTIQITD